MRKITILLINCVLIFSLAACSSNSATETTNQSNSVKSEEASIKNTGVQQPISVTKTPIAKPDGRKHTIVFSTFYEEDFINKAVKKYEAEHPNITIKLNIAHPKGSDANWDAHQEKFVKTMNSHMLAGKGPDVLEMDQLPIGQYVSKKALLNLSELMDNDPSFQRDQYFTNILDNVKLNGSVYGMPVRFYLYADGKRTNARWFFSDRDNAWDQRQILC